MANTLKIKRGTAATIPQGQLAEPLFTTDTYDLYIGKGSGGNQRIQNYIASGTSSQFLKGDGTLDSTSYEPLITAGTTLQYYRGDKTFQTLDTSVVPENGPIYFTEPRVRATVLTGLNLSGGGTIAATDSILTAFGKVQNQISAFVGGATYQGTWNASTNTPTLASGTGTKGFYYVVSVAGSTNLDGITDWKIGDWAIFNGTTWDKVDNTDAVSSVNGFTGAVNLGLGNISDVTLSSPTNTQLLRFNGTNSKWENWTPTYISGNQTITLSGDVSGSGTTTITTTIGAGKVTNAMLAGSIAASKLVGTDIATVGTITTGIWNGTTIAIADGGTGATTKTAAFNALSPMTTLGDIIYGGASGAGTRLAGNTAASKRFLIQTGDGTNSAAPSWGSIAAGDVPTLNQNTTGSAATLTTARTFTIGATGKTFDGSANVSWSLAEIGAQATLTNPVTGTGTNNYIPKFTATGSTIGDSTIFDNGNVGINVGSSPYSVLDVGTANAEALLIGNTSTTIVSGDVIGNISFYSRDGSTNSRGTIASIRSYATATYDTGSVSGDLRFYVSDSTQPNGAIISGAEALRINPDRSIRMLSYTTNGILKVSGGDGTISIAVAGDFPTLNQNTTGNAATATKLATARDFTINGTAKSFDGSANVSWTAAEIGLTSYLPLTGGTLTGALSGTSATFSGNITFSSAGSTSIGWGGNTSAAAAYPLIYSDNSYLAINSKSGSRLYLNFDNTNASSLVDFFAGKATINKDGAATFSSSVGVGGTNTDSLLTINGTAGTSHERFREGSTTVGFVGGANGIITGHNGKLALRAESGLILSGTGNSPDVIIASGGAATFSSSVTATGGLISNGGSIGYGGGELGFNVTTSGATSGIYTTATGSPILYFDHRATGNTGFWVWRSGTGGGTTALTLSNAGAATFSSSVTADGLIRGNSGIMQLFEASTFRGGVYTYKQWIGSGTDYSMVFGSNGELSLIAGGGTTKQVVLTTGGNVGIGTTSPTDLIHAAAGTAAGLSLQATGTGGSTWRILSTDNAASISGGKIGFNNGSYRMVIDGSGNVGIGTTSPETLLHINSSNAGGEGGYIYIDNPAASTLGNKAGIKFGTSSGASFATVPTGEITNVVTNASTGASALTFGTFDGASSAERMRITSGGDIIAINSFRSKTGFNLYRGDVSRGGIYDYASISGSGTDYSTTIFSETGQGIYFAANGSATRMMTITSGNGSGSVVLIGKTATNSYPTNTSSLQIDGAAGSLFETSYNGTKGLRVGSDATTEFFHSSRNVPINFFSNNSVNWSLQITANGQVAYTALSPSPNTSTITNTTTATPVLNSSDTYIYIGNSTSAYTLTIANPNGTPTQGQKLLLRFKDNGTQVMGISFGTQFRASSDLALPTTTTAGKTLYCGFIYNSTDTKWDMVALLNNF